MMATTHGLAGLVLGLLTLVLSGLAPGSESGATVLWAAFLGGVFPDADLYAGHRRRLHYPAVYPVLAGVALAVAWIAPTPTALVAWAFLGAAALHCGMDALGGGLELRPWRATSDRAVYDHVRGTWIRPRRWVRYDGAPEDVALAVALAAPLWFVAAGRFRFLVAGALAVSLGYGTLRRPLAGATASTAHRLPDELRPYLPERFYEDRSEQQ